MKERHTQGHGRPWIVLAFGWDGKLTHRVSGLRDATAARREADQLFQRDDVERVIGTDKLDALRDGSIA